ncbi:CDP-diacylglycerol--serine O-phosphatidyltransferase [Cytophagaceae bacterium ABcell3]|nr:CDP-diacylglycerol--serine O-phosphatidyltransferase [Cytophagaceae bacterium ABcell3]
MKKHIPNFITCLNLASGFIGIIETLNGRLYMGAWLIVLACIFDFFDGFAARMLRVTSPIGKQLDSLADMVTFGVLPGLIMFQLLHFSVVGQYLFNESIPAISYLAVLIPIFSALRLAKFNIDERQTTYFIGVPTPTNAILIASFALIVRVPQDNVFFFALQNTYILAAITIVTSLLLVSEIRLISLKFKGFSWKDNIFRYLLIIVSVIALSVLQLYAIPVIIILYIILSLIERTYHP